MNALHVSAGRCAVMVLRELLSNDNYGMDVNSPDGDGNTALHHASSSSPNNGRGDGGSSSLDAVRILVEEYGADVLRRNGAGRTPYDAASTQAVRSYYLLPRQLQAENPAVMIVADEAGDFVNGGGDFVRGGVPPPREREAIAALQQFDNLEEELEARLRNLRRNSS
jgi:ankyrin repeat protein